MSARETLIQRYAAGGEILGYATQFLTEKQIRARTGPGSWSIAELVGHLVDSDLVASERMKRVIADENPLLINMDETAWVERLHSQDISLNDAVSLFALNRRWVTGILKPCSDSDFARVGQHTVRGRMTLAELVTVYVNHLDHHLRFLYGKRANVGSSLQPRYSYPTL